MHSQLDIALAPHRAMIDHIDHNGLLPTLAGNEVDPTTMLGEYSNQYVVQELSGRCRNAIERVLLDNNVDELRIVRFLGILTLRFAVVRKVGEIKRELNANAKQPGRWAELLHKLEPRATELGLDYEEFITPLWNAMHLQAIQEERALTGEPDQG